jgi:arsenite methyltransferase
MTTTDAKFWDKIAETYAAKPVSNVPAFERKKALTRECLRPDATVLELGCGTGTLALEMARYAGHIHAIDVSSEMIRIAKQKQHTQGVANVTFTQGKLDASAYPPAHFDCVWAYSVLHLVPERKVILESLFSLLKPGGWFIASNVCLGDSWLPHEAVISVMRWFQKAPVVFSYTRATMLREMHETGFVDVHEKDVGAGKLVAFVLARKPA